MNSFRSIIDAIGAPKFAELIGVTESHARVMRARDSVPPEYWADLVAKQPETLNPLLTFDALRGLRRGRFKPSESKQTMNTSASCAHG